MTNLLLDTLITEDDYIEIEKIILNLKKSYIYDLYFAIFFLYSSCYVISYLFTLCTLPSFDSLVCYICAFEFIVRLASTSYATCDGVGLNCKGIQKRTILLLSFFVVVVVAVIHSENSADRFENGSKQVLIR